MNIHQRFSKILANRDFCKQNLLFIVTNFYNGTLSEQDMSQFLFDVCKNGFSDQQTIDLTSAMMSRGELLDFCDNKMSVDKHSTGGVSDSTTLIVVPLFALLGFDCYKMSGGALGHTGGTADKLGVFEGINIQLDSKDAFQIVKQAGGCFCCQSAAIAPIDKKIYALRDKIGAVMSIPLIASSIMSKKLALGAKNIVLDVKFGDGALIKDKTQAMHLAQIMCAIGNSHNRNTKYVLGDMSQPLGNAIGDRYEVLEVLWLLKHFCDSDLLAHATKLVCAFSQELNLSKELCQQKCYELLKSGKVYDKLCQIVNLQGGKMPNLQDISKLDGIDVCAKNSGKVVAIKTQKLGELFHSNKQVLGGYVCKRIGQSVNAGEPIFRIFGNPNQKFAKDILDLWEIK